MFAGRLASSRSHLEAVLALYDPNSHRPFVEQAGMDVVSQANLGNVLFCLGFSDQALASSEAAIAEARRLAHLPSLAMTLAWGTALLSHGEDNAALGERADQLVELATEQSFLHWRAEGTIYRGWVKVKNGDLAEGISLLHSGLAAYRATGSKVWMPHFVAFLAGACEIAGQVEEGVTLLDDALQIVERTGERWFAAELNRHKGLLLLQQGHTDPADELYRKALSIAVEQGAKLWELRAAVSLARLRRDQGRRAEAHDLLAPSMTGLPKASPHPISKRQRRCSTSSGDSGYAFGPHNPVGGEGPEVARLVRHALNRGNVLEGPLRDRIADGGHPGCQEQIATQARR